MADAGNLFDLAATVSVDAKGVDSALTSTQKKVQSLESDFKKLDKTVSNSFRSETASKLNALRSSLGIDKLGSGINDLKAKAAGLKAIETAAKGAGTAVSRDLQGALSTLSPSLAGVAGAAGPLTTVAAGLLAIGGAAAGIYKLATYSAQLGGEIYDLSQKVNFGAETLSGLKIAAELSGGSLASLSTSLGIFDRNMEEANQKGSEMSRVFKVLKLDTDDNEKALRQAFAALAKMPPGYQQTAVAMKLFGRSGKEILGIVKETGGNVEEFIEKMRAMGLVITDSGAKKADEFGDQLTIVRNKLEAVGRQIGQELIPTVSQAATDISNWLNRNQSELRATASELGTVVSWVYKLAKAVSENSLLVMTVRVVQQFESIAEGSRQGIAEAVRKRGTPIQLGPLGMQQLGDDSQEYAGVSSNYGSTDPWKNQPKLDFGKGGGGGKRGGGGTRKDELEGLKNALVGLNAEYRKYNTELLGSVNASALAGEKEKLLSTIMSGLKVNTRLAISELTDLDAALEKAIGSLPKKAQAGARALLDQSLAQFKSNEEARIGAELTKQVEELTRQWATEIKNTTSGADEYTTAIQNLEEAYRKYQKVFDPLHAAELQSLATKMRLLKVERDRLVILNQTRERMVGSDITNDLGGGSFVFRGDAERGRVVTTERQLLDEQLAIFHQQMDSLAADVTYTLSSALREGFEQGIKAGLVSFAQGILQMIESAALDALQKKLTDVFTVALGGGSSSGGVMGWILKALGIVGPALGGMGGGGASAGASGVASGILAGFRPHKSGLNYVPFDNYPALLHKGERVVPANENRGGGGNTFVVNVHVPSAAAAGSQATQHQVAKQLHGLMAKVVLTG